MKISLNENRMTMIIVLGILIILPYSFPVRHHIVASPLTGSPNSSDTRSNDTFISADIPTLVSGDTWEYLTELNVSLGMSIQQNVIVLEGTLTEFISYAMNGLTPVNVNGTEFLCYRMDFSGHSSLNASGMGGIVHVVMDFDIKGTEYWSVHDLSIVKIDTFRNGTLTTESPFGNDVSGFNITTNESFDKPMEEFDFPQNEGEEWGQVLYHHTNTTGDLGGMDVNDTAMDLMEMSYISNGSSEISTAVGTMHAWVIDVDQGERTIHYAPNVRNIALEEFNSGTYLDIPGLTVDIRNGSSALISYGLEEQVHEFQIIAPSAAAPNSVIGISGNISGIDSGQINIHILGLNVSEVAMLTNGTFSHSIYLDNETDSTPCISDLGSHGMVVYLNSFLAYEVFTVTLAQHEVRIFPENISFNPSTGAIPGTRVNISMKIENPSIVPMYDLPVRVEETGKDFRINSSISIPPGETGSLRIFWTPFREGIHNITVVLDPNGLFNESNEKNNRATVQYRVSIKSIPALVNVAPLPGNITIHEGEDVNFSARGVNPDGSTPMVEWWLDGVRVTPENDTYRYVTDHNSSGNHTLAVMVKDFDEPMNSSMSSEIVWHMIVLNVNRKCTAVISLPPDNAEFEKGFIINFSANGSGDPDIDPSNLAEELNFTWYFGDGSYAFGMNVNHYYNESGRYEVRLNVSDPEGDINASFIYLNITKADPGETPADPDDGNLTDPEGDSGTKDRAGGGGTMFCGLVILLIFLAVVIIIIVKRRKRRERGNTEEGTGKVDDEGAEPCQGDSIINKPVLRHGSEGKPLVECNDLEKTFILPGGGKYPVLKGIDLKVMPGEFITLMGPSGSGKSTLLNIIGAMIPATGGGVKVNGKNLNEMDFKELTGVRRSDVGWIFQDFNLIENLTALENVIIPMNLAGKVDDGAEKRARELLDLVNIGDRANHFPDNLSGGEQQRTAIARALVNDPPLILADEPTGNLDSASGEVIIKLFRELARQKKSILMVTHDIELAKASDRVYVIRNGRLEESLDGEVIV